MKIEIPENIKHLENELKTFVDAMVYKLSKNAHKGKWEDMTIETLGTRMEEELDELHEAADKGNTIEIILESSDVANFAMMIASVAVRDAAKSEGTVKGHMRLVPRHGAAAVDYKIPNDISKNSNNEE